MRIDEVLGAVELGYKIVKLQFVKMKIELGVGMARD